MEINKNSQHKNAIHNLQKLYVQSLKLPVNNLSNDEYARDRSTTTNNNKFESHFQKTTVTKASISTNIHNNRFRLSAKSRKQVIDAIENQLIETGISSPIQTGVLNVENQNGEKVSYVNSQAPLFTVLQKLKWPETTLQNKIIVSAKTFRKKFSQKHKEKLTYFSSWRLFTKSPEFSSAVPINNLQLNILLCVCFLCIGAVLVNPYQFLLISSALMLPIFMMLSYMRLSSIFIAEHKNKLKSKLIHPIIAVDNNTLPRYSVLVAVYNEVEALPKLIKGLEKINYPTDLLEIFILIEEDDLATQQAFYACNAPEHIEALIVPDGNPRTKPRALNYGLHFATGEFVTIYDAEDLPEPDQLRKAVSTFRSGPDHLACLQAELSIYNRKENWLTAMFATEYKILFSNFLPFLAKHNLIVPLGGTSNHFKRKLLQQVGGWDPHNVTEDADLGIRFARLGYSCDVVDSYTIEEALPRLKPWLLQRSRWLKGWMQCYATHLREPKRFLKEVGLKRFLGLHVTIGIMLFAGLVHPTCIILLLCDIIPYLIAKNGTSIPSLSAISFLYILNAILGYGSYLLNGIFVLKDQPLKDKLIFSFTFPFYWVLMSISCYIALYEFFINPFYWHKSPHRGQVINKAEVKFKKLNTIVKSATMKVS